MDVRRDKEPLIGKTLSELTTICEEGGFPKFTAKQIADWIYKKRVLSIDEMTNLSVNSRDWLNQRYETGRISHTKVSASSDGTKKYLFKVEGNYFVEAAYIPDNDRATLCVSSQVGCKMNCHFCQTAKQGYQRNLSAAEIINQILSLPEFESLSNIVYMGMGEPFNNTEQVLNTLKILTSDYGLAWSPKRITVSTIGIIPGMKIFLEESLCHLAVSLHTPFEKERSSIMPVEKKYPLEQVISEIKKYDFSKQRRVSFEYIMFKGLNDTQSHINELSKLLNGLQCRINLIRYHQIPDVELTTSDDKTIEWFKDQLNKKGITTTIRASRGQDIDAACGLLSTREYIVQK